MILVILECRIKVSYKTFCQFRKRGEPYTFCIVCISSSNPAVSGAISGKLKLTAGFIKRTFCFWACSVFRIRQNKMIK